MPTATATATTATSLLTPSHFAYSVDSTLPEAKMANSNVPLNPTFVGHVASTLDALVLFEACLSSALQHVPRRPHDRERQDLIKSGNVFIYEEHSSGIKRWTDGVAWSPSRILGNFLIYRELDRPFPPGEKKRAMKRNKKTTGVTKPSDVASRQGSVNGAAANMPGMGDGSTPTKDAERALIGSLVDSYPFKENGLVKKTISVTYQGVPHHLVSYYNVEDVTEGKLLTPSKDHQLSTIIPRGELIMSQNFRAPIDEVEMDDSRAPHGGGLFAHPYPVNSHHQSMSRAMSVPSLHHMGGMGTQFGQASYIPQYLSAVPGSVGNVGYAQPQHHPYYDNMGRPNRYASGAGLGSDLSRTIALEPQHHPRRHSTAYEPTSGPDMSLTGSLPAVPDPARSMGGNYMSSMLYSQQPQRVTDMSSHEAFPAQSPRNVHSESGLGGDSSATTSSKIASKIPAFPKNLHEDIYTIPNILTLSRLVAAPFVGYFILHDQHAWALGLFAYAGVTDLLDGWIARRWNLQTVVGTVIDPMADKTLMTILTVCLAAQGSLPVWLATIILGRDVGLAISAIYYRWISLPPPKTFARYWDFSLPSAEVRPTTISKYNTFLQLALVGLTTAAPVLTYDLSTPLTVLQYIVATTTVWSGASYVFSKDAVKILSAPKDRLT
ncbi:Gti1/Pac2 family protein [Colletotrichum camelliae]|nr:Gti1/Pac2 family protein [Colletotrichum camelliae]